MVNSIFKYNKGEWSEIYAFLFALGNGKIHGADENLNSMPNLQYDVISTFNHDTEYKRENDINVVFYHNEEIREVPLSEIEGRLGSLFNSIKMGKSQFEIPDIIPLLNQLEIDKLKAGSKLKGDLKIKVHDSFTNTEPILNFSVKSYIGSNPTLLNASSATTFTYRLSQDLSKEEISSVNSIATKNKMIDKIGEINRLGASLEYEKVSSDIFSYNLQMIDFSFPKLLANLYLESYFVKGKKIPDVITSFVEKNPDFDAKLIEYKVRQFLIACALGMVPLTKWDGMDEATGGYIVVKDNADVLCYHLYNRNKLSDYLFKHTSFDTPSSSRYGLGEVKEEDGYQHFDLNVQIRFANASNK